MQQLARPGGQLPLLPTQNHQKHWRLSSAAAAGTAAVQQPATLTSRVLPVKKFHQQQQQQQHVDGHPQQQQQQEPHQQQQQQTLPSLSPGSSRQQARQQKQYGLSRTLQALRSTGVTAAEAARASPQLLTSAITQCESLGEALQVRVVLSAVSQRARTGYKLWGHERACVQVASHRRKWRAELQQLPSAEHSSTSSFMYCSVSMGCH